MKFKLLAVIAVTALTIASCKWFNSESKNGSLITGTWKLDSITPGKDSSGIGILLLAMVMQEDSTLVKVTNDSVYGYGDQPVAYSVNKENTKLVLKDSENTTYNILLLNDSLLHLRDSDSAQMFFVRTK